MKRILPPIVAALLAASPCLAQLKSERVPAAAADTAYSMDAQNVSVADAVAAFRKQTGIAVVFNDDNGRPDRGPPILYDVKFDKLSADDATRQLARTLSLGVIDNGDGGLLLSRNSWSSDAPWSDKPGVRLMSVTRTQSLPPSPDQPDALNLGLRVSRGGRPTDGTLRFKIIAATDDQGRSVEMPNDGTNQRFMGGMNFSNSEMTLRLTLPLPRPAKLAVVRGTAVTGRPKTVLRVTADKLPDNAVDCDFDGGTLSVGPMTANGKAYDLPMNFTRGSMPQDRWTALQQQANRLRNTVELYAQDGTRLVFNSNGWSSGGDTLRVSGQVRLPDSFNGNARADMPRPVKLKFDTIVETEPDEIPFEFKDVVVP